MKVEKIFASLFLIFSTVMFLVCLGMCFLLDFNQKQFSSINSFGGGVMATLLIVIAFENRKSIYEKLKTSYIKIQNKITAQDDYNAIFNAVKKNDILTTSHDDVACELESIFTKKKPYQSKNGFIFFEQGTLYKAPLNDINSAKALSNKTFYNKLSNYREHYKNL